MLPMLLVVQVVPNFGTSDRLYGLVIFLLPGVETATSVTINPTTSDIYESIAMQLFPDDSVLASLHLHMWVQTFAPPL